MHVSTIVWVHSYASCSIVTELKSSYPAWLSKWPHLMVTAGPQWDTMQCCTFTAWHCKRAWLALQRRCICDQAHGVVQCPSADLLPKEVCVARLIWFANRQKCPWLETPWVILPSAMTLAAGHRRSNWKPFHWDDQGVRYTIHMRLSVLWGLAALWSTEVLAATARWISRLGTLAWNYSYEQHSQRLHQPRVIASTMVSKKQLALAKNLSPICVSHWQPRHTSGEYSISRNVSSLCP